MAGRPRRGVLSLERPDLERHTNQSERDPNLACVELPCQLSA